MALLLAVYVRAERAERAAAPGDRLRTASWIAGVAVLWAALDWPVGALGGYLASVHMVQFLMVAHLAPPLLIHGIPPATLERLRASRAYPVIEFLTRPVIALVIFNVTMVAVTLPPLVDRLMPTPAGSFVVDALWLFSGLVLWWPIVARVPARPGFDYPLKMGYLFLNTFPATALAAFLTFGQLPIYATYELAPPVAGISARLDQQLAGLFMKFGHGGGMFVAMSILFFRWQQRDGGAVMRDTHELAAQAKAGPYGESE
jgi:cytochrome c oxidase assembly factor CtaG